MMCDFSQCVSTLVVIYLAEGIFFTSEFSNDRLELE